MPNRVFRDWTASEKIDKISAEAERLFTRLMMKADDFGSFHAKTKLINALCFPLKTIRDSDISRWLDELIAAGLIAVYTVDGKEYLNILNFNQRLRSYKNAFPRFDNDSLSTRCQVADNSPPEEKRREVETEDEDEGKGLPPPPPVIKGYYSIETLYQKSLSDDLFVEAYHRQGIIKDLLARWLSAFNRKLTFDNSTLKQETDYRQHFKNWLNKQDIKSNPDSYSPAQISNKATSNAYSNAEERAKKTRDKFRH